MPIYKRVSTHSRPKAAGFSYARFLEKFMVSTHSRPKAAGFVDYAPPMAITRFNTQPPEGGWGGALVQAVKDSVSTHSRPKAAGVMEESVKT